LTRKRSAILCAAAIALGVAACVAAFSIADGVLFRPLPYADADRLVLLLETNIENGRIAGSIPAAMVSAITERSQTLECLGGFGFGGGRQIVDTASGRKLIDVLPVTPSLFRVLRVTASQGMSFTGSIREDSALAVVSSTLARRVAPNSGLPAGRHITTDEGAYTVIGVLPPDFVFPPYVVGRTPDLYTALEIPPGAPEASRVLAIGRLKARVTISEARAEVMTISRGVYRGRFGNRNSGIYLADLREHLVGKSRPPALWLLVGAGLFATISWVNAGQLLLARFWMQRRELAIRSVLGASPGRLMSGMLVEVLGLAAAGTAVGTIWGAMALRFIARSVPRTIAPLTPPTVDGRVLVLCGILAVATGVGLGILIATQVRQIDVRRIMVEGVDGHRSVGRVPVRSVLMAVEVASATVLLCVALTVAYELSRAFVTDPGFDRDPVLVVWPVFPAHRYLQREERHHFVEALAENLRHRGAVVGAIDLPPLSGATNLAWYAAWGSGATPHEMETRSVSGDYFRAMGIRLVQGRVFKADLANEDTNTAVVSDRVARLLWPAATAIGQRLVVEGEPPLDVIGIVGDIQDGRRDSVLPTVYRRADGNERLVRSVVARDRQKGAALQNSVTDAAAKIDPAVAIEQRSMAEALAQETSMERFALWASVFGVGIAVLQVVLGVFGVVVCLVQTRLREIGVRLAVGATLAGVRRRLMWQGLAVAAAGVGGGSLAFFVIIKTSSNWLVSTSSGSILILVIGATLSILMAMGAIFSAVKYTARCDVWRMLIA